MQTYLLHLVFNANWNTFAFHKFTPWYGRVNLFISRMIESGLFQCWEERSVGNSRQYLIFITSAISGLGRICGQSTNPEEKNPSRYMRKLKQTLCSWRTAPELFYYGPLCWLLYPWGKTWSNCSCFMFSGLLSDCSQVPH